MVQTKSRNFKKSPSPEPFKEPDNMITIDLSKSLNDLPEISKKIPKNKLSVNDIIKYVFALIGLFLLVLLCFLVLSINRGYLKNLRVVETPISHVLENKDKIIACKISKSFEDCCYVFFKTDLFDEVEKCTVEKVLDLFLQYELEANKRIKRQNYGYTEYPNQFYGDQNPPNMYPNYQNQYFPSESYDRENINSDYLENKNLFMPQREFVISQNTEGIRIDTESTTTKLCPKSGCLDNGNASVTNQSLRISQGHDAEIQINNQGKQLNNPCFYPFSNPFGPPFRASTGFETNPLFSVVPSNVQHQPLYVINPPIYPYIPLQYQGYNNFQSQGINKGPIQVSGAGGQFYWCNPVSLPSNNIGGLPGVEIRRTSEAFTLQDLVTLTPMPIQSNKTREAIDCPFGEQSCDDGSKCIHNHQVCNNEVDCNDGSDEMDCSCKYRVGEIRWCDGFLDCPNGEDEMGCFDCAKDEFSCDDWSRFRRGTCIPLSQRCDGISQCEVTDKDEEDCSILTDHLGQHSLYKISNAAGFLHRNYKGIWYPTCFGADVFSLEVCKTEAGPSAMLPKTQMVTNNDNYPGLFINVGLDNKISLAETCLRSEAAYVECPPIFCGLRLTINNPFRSSEVDTSAEDLLNHMQRLSSPHNTTFEEIVSSPRVVGGKPSQPAAWPWVVSIYKNGIFHCGGVLINELWIVTAAHCVARFWLFYYEIQVGMLRRFSYSPMEQNRWAVIAVPHENYNKRTLKNDIALMKLSKPVRYNRYVRPICLPSEATAGEDFLQGPKPYTICVTVGWGALVEHGTDPDHLREVEIPIWSQCKHHEDQEGDEICAGLHEGGRDACQGDSGGPLMCQNIKNRNQWYLAGIVSHGEGCARPNEPGVYTKVSKYVGWIGETINGKIIGRFPLRKCPGYTCKGTKRCLSKKKHCDKIVDCLLGDDEFNCSNRKSSDEEIVGSTHNGFFHRLFHLLRLDDSSEEITTLNSTLPTKNKEFKKLPDIFRCRKMLQVLPFHKKCDRIVDCEDGTDESDCLCVDYIRSHVEAICDGVTDCKDLSDETDCVKCLPGQHLCRINQKCIPLKNRCDGIVDCINGEDEWDCVALTDGRTLVFDNDLRPKQTMKGIITINRFGVWRPLCTNGSVDNTASIVTNVCNLLGFEEYTVFHKLSVTDKPLNVTIEGFERYHSSLDNLEAVVCGGLFAGCSNTTLDNMHKLYQPKFYIPPWISAIYINGKFTCTGVILNESWILTAIGCFQNVRPRTSYIAVLLGKAKIQLDVESPHEQAIPIIELIRIEQINATILRTQEKINFNRYIKPVHLTTSFSGNVVKCVALGFEDERSKFILLKQTKKCPSSFSCFVPTDQYNFCKEYLQPLSGIVTCNSGNMWYLTTVFNNIKSPCDFSKYKFRNINKKDIENALGDVGEDISGQECEGFRCILGQCIEKNKICNGISECRNSEDEDVNLCRARKDECHLSTNCVNYSFCEWSEFQCMNGKCIPKSSFCDSNNDCGDYSDEPALCSCAAYMKGAHPEKNCDGTVNCWDRSDEDPHECKCKSPTNVPCGKTRFCVSNEMVCDGFRDCPGGEDESICYSLRTNFTHMDSGEVMKRTAGVWHSGCFSRNHTTSELEEICEQLGFAGGSAKQMVPPRDSDNITTMNPVRDHFNVVWIRRDKGNKLKLRLRTGNEPYMKFMKDSTCHNLYIECL